MGDRYRELVDLVLNLSAEEVDTLDIVSDERLKHLNSFLLSEIVSGFDQSGFVVSFSSDGVELFSMHEKNFSRIHVSPLTRLGKVYKNQHTITFRKILGALELEITIGEVASRKKYLEISFFTSKTGQMPTEIALIDLRGSGEELIASKSFGDEKFVRFGDIAEGKYKIEIRKRDEAIGEFEISIVDSQ